MRLSESTDRVSGEKRSGCNCGFRVIGMMTLKKKALSFHSVLLIMIASAVLRCQSTVNA